MRLRLHVGVGARALELALDEVLAPHAATPGGPELRLERAERHPAVGALVRAVADQRAGQLELPAPRRRALGQVAPGDEGQPGQRAVGHRHVDELPFPRARVPGRSIALAQRGQDAERRHQRAAAEVGDLSGRLNRRTVAVAAEAEQPDEPEVVHVVPRAVAKRPGLPVAADRAVHEAGVLLAQGLVADAEPLEHAGAEGLEQDVAVADQATQHLAALLVLEVDADRALVAVQRQEHRRRRGRLDALVLRRRPAHVVAHAGVLDLDDVGAEVGQQLRAEPARQQAREVEHAHAVQRQRTHEATGAALVARLRTPISARACSTVAGRRPTSSHSWRALAIRSPLERAIVPSGR